MNAKRRTLAVLAAVIAVLGLALWALNRSTALPVRRPMVPSRCALSLPLT